ncbi:very short patch repair endonuclease [Brevibacterium luteolum]|uniref:DNA mismatch endonuclease Vsr n=1 Tax=Brevibacterium luteolum TaxID=199591 RepID=A0A849ASK5_9MICO|nr:very short patch repair endonuclease [Brevibacterium luteolum]NNG80158.1 DNA mismatch endonuclease Vsr [Brevibacterium luteolum]
MAAAGSRQSRPRSTPGASSAGRRRNMQAIRRKNTKPELKLRSQLHALGYRYRCDLRIDLPTGRVRPDIVFTRRKVAVFVDGCFWHSCPEHGRQPNVHESYWAPKLRRTVERDRRNTESLALAGWYVVRIWEHVPLAEAVTSVIEAVRIQDRRLNIE